MTIYFRKLWGTSLLVGNNYRLHFICNGIQYSLLLNDTEMEINYSACPSELILSAWLWALTPYPCPSQCFQPYPCPCPKVALAIALTLALILTLTLTPTLALTIGRALALALTFTRTVAHTSTCTHTLCTTVGLPERLAPGNLWKFLKRQQMGKLSVGREGRGWGEYGKEKGRPLSPKSRPD